MNLYTQQSLRDPLFRIKVLDQPVSISINHAPPREFKPTRNLKAIRDALTKRLDPSSSPTASIEIK